MFAELEAILGDGGIYIGFGTLILIILIVLLFKALT